MAIFRIPLRNDLPSYEFKVAMDGATFTMAIRFNTRHGVWVMDLKTEQNEDIVLGIPLVIGTILTARFADNRLPQGDLFMLNIENESTEATRDSLSENALLMYSEAT